MGDLGNDSRVPASASRSPTRRVTPPGILVPGRTLTAVTPTTGVAPESLLHVVWRGRWIMLICIVLALSAGLAYVETATPIYTSTAKLYLDYGGIPIAQSYEPGRAPRMTDRYIYTQAQLLVSRPILSAVLALPDIGRLQTFAGIDTRLAYLQRNIHVEVGRKDEIISVSFSSPYAGDVPQIINKMVDTYIDSRSDSQQEDSSQALALLQEEMTRAKAELDEKRDELETFERTSMGLTLGSDQGSGVTPLFLTLQTELTQARLQASDAKLLFDNAQKLADDPEALRQYALSRGSVPTNGGSGNEVAQLEAQRRSAESELASLRLGLTADHPRITALRTQIERLKTTIDELNDRFVRGLLATAELRYRDAQDRQEDAARRYQEESQKVEQWNREVRKYHRLAAEESELLTHYQAVTQQFRDFRTIVGEDVDWWRMEILEPASLSEEPSSPQKGKIMTMALVLGLLAGGGLAVLRDFMDQTLRSADEMSAVLGLPVLGVVPAMSRKETIPARGQKIHLQPDLPEAEAFRTVRTAIFFGAHKGTTTMLITSPATGDGKSTLASNLAIALAQAGQRTIILDADLRKPMQHVIFETEHAQGGVSAVLWGRMKLGQAIQPTQVQGLSLLPCGSKVPNPSEILNGQQFALLLEQLAQTYDRVIIDAPPVTMVADAQILGALCDATILVLRAGKSTRKIGQRAIDGLYRVGAHLLGMVVNDVPKSGDRYGYYGGYAGPNGSGRGTAKAVKMREPRPNLAGPPSALAMTSEGG